MEVAENILSNTIPLVLSDTFIECSKSVESIIACLGFLDLPFNSPGVHEETDESSTLTLTSQTNFITLVKKIEEKVTERLPIDMVISQKFYDPQDKFSFDEANRDVKTIKEVHEFLVAKVYESQVTYTNLSENFLRIKLIHQIPEGAVPVYNLDDLKIHEIDLGTLQTQVKTFKFYFPQEGSFGCYPSTIVKKNRLVTHAQVPTNLVAVKEFTRGDQPLQTLQDILNYGTQEDIIKFLEEKNLFDQQLFSIEKILWLFANKEYYYKAIEILRNKCFFSYKAWAYSIKHGDLKGFGELLKGHKDFRDHLRRQYKYLKTKLVRVDNFSPREYDPLINPRVHSLSQKEQVILNTTFRDTYHQFLWYCVERGTLTQREWIIFTSYLTLQDRIEEALRIKNEKLNHEEIFQKSIMTVQYDYLRSYLSIYEEHPEFETAREVYSKYRDFPDISWRKRFKQIKTQLVEYDGEDKPSEEQIRSAKKTKDRILKSKNEDLAKSAEFLKAEYNKARPLEISVTSMNVGTITVSYFKLNMEVLFTDDPFLDKNIKNFSFVNPNHEEVIQLAATSDFSTRVITLPEELSSCGLYVHVRSQKANADLKIFNSNLKVHAIEEFGLVKVASKQSKLLSSIYVKCYSKAKGSGEVKFYKDGYTDFRGSFDYASLNSDSLDKVEKFALLVTDKIYGSYILQVNPPRKVGQIKAL